MADWIYDVVMFFGRHSAWLLIPAAVIIYLWVVEAFARREELSKEEWDQKIKISSIVKVFSGIGMIYGVLLMVGAVAMELSGSSPSLMYKVNHGEVVGGEPQDVVNHFTTIVYFLTGMIMFFKPMKDVPLASLIALGAAGGATIFCLYYIPSTSTGEFIVNYVVELQWLLLIVFLLVLSITYTLAKISFNLMLLLSKILSKAPFAFVYASFVLVQAILLLFGYSIVYW